GSSTLASAAKTKASAPMSCHCGRSPRIAMPESTPTTGIMSVDSDDTATGAAVAMRVNAQRQNTDVMQRLNASAIQAAVPDGSQGPWSCSRDAIQIGMPPMTICQPVSAAPGSDTGQ